MFPDMKLPQFLMTVKSRWTRPWFQRAVITVLLVTLFLGLRGWQQRTLVHGPTPPLSATALNGDSLVVGRGAQPTLVYFWASWCGICRLKEGSMESIARDHRVISVALSSGDDKEVRQYLASRGLKLPVINDPEGAISARWGVRATPTAFIVDRDGVIRFREVGYTTEWGLRLRMWWVR